MEYKGEKREEKEFRGIQIEMYENVAICEKCKKDLYVNELEEENNTRIYNAYQKKSNCIPSEEMYRAYIKHSLIRRTDIYNGYQTFDLELLENIISYLASKVKNLTISINKYL